jgi:hypothetical protein
VLAAADFADSLCCHSLCFTPCICSAVAEHLTLDSTAAADTTAAAAAVQAEAQRKLKEDTASAARKAAESRKLQEAQR